jgi:hypothetical protein
MNESAIENKIESERSMEETGQLMVQEAVNLGLL